MGSDPERREGGEPEVTFERSLGFFDATMIGIGAMIGAGIFVLTGIASGEAGPAALLAFGLNGVVTLITAMVYAELASKLPEAGGGYAFVKNAFPDVFAFVSGWWLWFAYTTACALYAAGFGSYLLEFLARYFPASHGFLVSIAGEHAAMIALIVLSGVAFTALNVRGAEVTGKTENVIVIAKVVVLFVFIVFGLEAILDDVPAACREFTPFFPKGLGGVFVAMGLTFIAFEGYDLIATVAEEIKDPTRNIPRATFVSVGVTVVIYLAVIVVSLGAVHPEGMASWEFLGEYQETAIVKAAAKMMPGVGVFLIVLGGVLSTMSALNATVLASSRVAFSMARDGWLPARVAAIHQRRRTPHVAIIATGAIFVATAVGLPIEALGSAASVMFLLVFALVNLALVALRRKRRDLVAGFSVPLYPVLPLAGFAINMALAIYQYTFNALPWLVVAGWTAAGLALYYAVFARQARAVGPQMLELAPPTPDADASRFRVVVPLANPQTVEPLIDIAAALVKPRGGEIVALSVAQVPKQLAIHEGLDMVEARRALIRTATRRAARYGVEVRGDLRVAHSLRQALIGAVRSHRAQLMVIGWKGFTGTRDRIFGDVTDHMIRHCPCDLAVVKVVPGPFERILLATAGGPHASLGATFALELADLHGATLDACVVVPEDADKATENATLLRIGGSLADLDPEGRIGPHVVRADSIPGGIAEASQSFDLVVIGATASGPFKQILAGDIPERVARFSPRSVLLVRRWQGPVHGVVRKLFG